eukprot:scaffold26758_cov64-Phaeocystis_antarctica.AAC.1
MWARLCGLVRVGSFGSIATRTWMQARSELACPLSSWMVARCRCTIVMVRSLISLVRESIVVSIAMCFCCSALISPSVASSTFWPWKKGSSSTASIGVLNRSKYCSRFDGSGSSSLRRRAAAAVRSTLAFRRSPELRALLISLRQGPSGASASVCRSSLFTLSFWSVLKSEMP